MSESEKRLEQENARLREALENIQHIAESAGRSDPAAFAVLDVFEELGESALTPPPVDHGQARAREKLAEARAERDEWKMQAELAAAGVMEAQAGLVELSQARAAQAQAEGAATKAVDAIWDCAEKFWEDARQANAEGDAEEERRAMAVHNYLAARWWNLSRTVPPSPRQRLETGRPQRPRRPERSPAPMAEPAETIATLEVGCLCRLQFAQEHPNHAFLGPCVHEQLAEATAAQSALKAELAEASKIIDGLVKANTQARAAQAQAEGAARRYRDALVHVARDQHDRFHDMHLLFNADRLFGHPFLGPQTFEECPLPPCRTTRLALAASPAPGDGTPPAPTPTGEGEP